jgi:hypothetical protein
MARLYPSLVFNLAYCEEGNCIGGEARFCAGEGQNKRYRDGSPEYKRVARRLGCDWESAENEDDEEEDDQEYQPQNA